MFISEKPMNYGPDNKKAGNSHLPFFFSYFSMFNRLKRISKKPLFRLSTCQIQLVHTVGYR